jgi:hypothetical protein
LGPHTTAAPFRPPHNRTERTGTMAAAPLVDNGGGGILQSVFYVRRRPWSLRAEIRPTHHGGPYTDASKSLGRRGAAPASAGRASKVSGPPPGCIEPQKSRWFQYPPPPLRTAAAGTRPGPPARRRHRSRGPGSKARGRARSHAGCARARMRARWARRHQIFRGCCVSLNRRLP